MLFNNLFGRKNTASSTSSSRKGVKINKKNHQSRRMFIEPLESRDLLTVTTGPIDNETYNDIRAAYPEFELPELQADLNVMTITPDDGALSLADLKSALATAGTTALPDLILVQTSADANSVTYASAEDELSININSTQYGSVTIIGWGEEKFTLDANQQSRVMRITGSSTFVNFGGLKIQNGYTENSGGGISSSFGKVMITNCEIIGNTASGNSTSYGGGIYTADGSLNIVNTTISENTASGPGGGINSIDSSVSITNCLVSENTSDSYGGGINSYNISGSLTITDSKISGNYGYISGGVYSNNSPLLISNSEITDNTTTNSGGGISVSGSNAVSTIIGCKISGNTGSFGGISANSATLLLSNSEITGNVSNTIGGSISVVNSSEATITNCTIVDNRTSLSSMNAGGVWIANNSVCNVYNSIIAFNTTSSGINDIKVAGTINGYNNLSSFTDWTDGANNIEYAADSPLFVNASEGDYRLVLTSQAVDKGANEYAIDAGLDETSLDVNGYPRLINSRIDIGAYELQSAVVTTLNDSFDPADGEWSLREAIYNATGYVTITFADNLEGQIDLTQGELVIDKPLAINGDSRITIDAAQNSRIFNISAGTDNEPVVLNGLVIQNGYSNDNGGGIYSSGTLKIANSRINNNVSSSSGGGIYSSASLTVTNSLISGNESETGGGIFASEWTSITNCTIVDNIANNRGRDFYQDNGTARISNSIILNSRDSFGGSVYFSPTVYYTGNYNLLTFPFEDNNSSNIIYREYLPLFIDAENGDYRLSPDSQAIDKGSLSYAMYAEIDEGSTDIYGKERVYGSSIDIGADEYQAEITYSSVVNTLNDSIDPYDDKWSLREALYYATGNETITFADDLNGTVTLTHGQLEINTALTINGDSRITIDGNRMDSVIYINAGSNNDSVVLKGLSIQNGNAVSGGGIFNYRGAVSVINCTISDNSVSNVGGGIYLYSGSATVVNSTIAGNSSSHGGGIYKYAGTLKVYNSIIASNYGGNVLSFSDSEFADPSDNQNNIIDYYPFFVCDPIFDSKGKLLNADTMDLHLQSFSFAIDNGKNSAAEGIDLDIDGNARIYGDRVDIGAYEYQGSREEIYYSTVVDTLVDSFDLTDGLWSLREAIFYAQDYTTITFADNVSGTIELIHGEILIDKPVSIDGAGRIAIDAGLNNRVFNINSGSEDRPVVLNGLTIQNGFETLGGGLYLYNSTVMITNCQITGNYSNGNGGGIYASGSRGSLTITDSEISGNTAASIGGGIAITDSFFTTTINNCTISDNTAYSRGGGLWIGGYYGTTSITDSVISGNSVIKFGRGVYWGDGGGGIYLSSGTLTIDSSEISDNESVTNGGGIFKEKGNLTIVNSKIARNSASSETSSGGGIYNNSESITIVNTEISANSAINQGGGIYQIETSQDSENALNIINCSIAGNAAYNGGSGIYSLSEYLALSNSIVSMNFADNISGSLSSSSENNLIDAYMPGFVCIPKFTKDGVLKNSGDIDLHLRSDAIALNMGNNSAIADFETDSDHQNRIYGDAVDLGPYEFQGDRIDEPIQYPTVVDTLNDSFVLSDDEWSLREAIYCAANNAAITFADGLSGTIVLTNGELNIDKALSIDGDNRISINGDQKSRVIHISAGDQNSPVVLNGLQIVNGSDGFAGGVYNESGVVTITNCTISDNTASLYGGAVVSSQGSITLSDSTISNNNASKYGGGIYQFDGTATITNCTISNNAAVLNGGGFYQESGESAISDSVFIHNTSTDNGGGLSLYNADSTITDSTISNNAAANGGGIVINGNSVSITNSAIINNFVSVSGGGMYAANSEVIINNSSIESNLAYTGDGGGIFNEQSQIYVNASVISENNSSENGNGGGVYSTGVFTILNSYLENNAAYRYGGGFCNYNTLSITNCVISGNSSNRGGGVYTGHLTGNENSGVFTSINSTISGNSASNGGGIYNSDSNNPISLKNSIVSLNHADSNSNIYGELASGSRSNLIDIQNLGYIIPPLFDPNGAVMNPDTMDLHLRSDSVAINQGNNFDIVGNNTDVDGNARVYGSSVDIGACEYQGDRDDEPIAYSSVVNTYNDSFDPYDDEWSLREAIYFASEYVTITFAEDIEGEIVLTRGPLYIDKALAIDGGGRISIESNKKSQIIYIDAGTESAPVALANLSIKNGYAKCGAGIYQNDGYTTVSDCIISDNTATNISGGGGIFLNSGTFLINNSVITRNSADYGAGIYDLPGASLTVTNCSISYNTAAVYGGGIYTCNDHRNITTIICCSFLGNSAKQSGGGLFNESTDEVVSCLIANCTFAVNTANIGGGIYNESCDSMEGSLKVLNSIISYNKSIRAGAGIYSTGNFNLYETLVSWNFSETEAIGVNYDGSIGDTYYTRDLLDEYDPGFVVAPGFDANGELVNAESIDLHLRSDSVAIDWGRSYALNEIETDIEGNVRKYGRYVDLGAYEYQGDRNDQPIAYSTVVTTLNDSFNLNDNEWSLREALFYAPDGAVISFDDSLHGTITLSLGLLNINKPVSIDGDGRITIDADKKSRVFYIKTGSQSAAVGLNGLTVQNGNASHGAGIYQYDSVTTVSDCTIANNTSSGDGGGYRIDSGTLLMTNCVLYGNKALSGGGFEQYGGVFTIVNSTIAGNTATSYGGGIYVTASSSNSIYNSIIVGNSARYENNDIRLSSATLNANNNISSFTGWDVNLNYEYDPYSPLFVNADSYDFHLAPGSQALNKGSNQQAINVGLDESATDIGGEPRFSGERIDIGAYESTEFSVSQSDIYTGSVYFTWKQYKNTANVRLTWLAGTTRTVLGVFGSVGEYTWDTTQFANEYGVLTAEYLDENGSSLMLSTHVGLILNNENVVVHRDNITQSETWSADKVHLLARNINIINNAALTIAQNAVVKFWKDSCIYTAAGSTLNVQKNVIFTRAEDDSVGGDTNLDGDLSKPGIGASYTRGAGTINIDSSVYMKYVTINVGGAISSNQTWKEGSVYHVTSSITVKQNVTLTIQPGAIIKFDSGTSLTVEAGGTLKAEGTALQPIVLTSIFDDEFGGDTNEDSSRTVPQAGDWNNIQVYGTAIFDHAIIRYTGNVSGSQGALYGKGGTVLTFKNSVLEFSRYYALSADGGKYTFINSVIREGQNSLVNMHSWDCTASFTNCTFVDSNKFLWCGWGNTSFVNCIIANITEKFIGHSNYAAFKHCVFWNAKGVGEQSFPTLGTNGKWANPLFRNQSEGDYHLMAGSPCIDAGTSSGAPTTDITSSPRAHDPYTSGNGTIDIGAYEFVERAKSSIDLEALNVQIPDTVTTGQTALVRWTIANNGSSIAKGRWTDSFYLYNEVSGQSILVKEYMHDGSIAAAGAQTFYTEVIIPNVTNGDWKLQLRVNSNRELFEGAAINNNSVWAETTTAVQTPLLTGSQGAITTRKNNPAVYRVNVNAGDCFSMQTYSYSPVTIYMRENGIPSSSSYDYTAGQYDPNHHALYIAPSDVDRVFYLLVETAEDYTGVEYDIRTEAELSVLGVSPQKASNMGSSTLTLTGTGFKSGMTVYLQSDAHTIVGTNVTAISGSSAIATFDLTGKPVGEYTLVVSLNDQTAVCSNPITVTQGVGAVVNSWLELPTSVRSQRVYSAKLYYENVGDCDALLPVFTINSLDDILLGWSANSVSELDLYALGMGSNESAGILKAGESGYVTFYFLAKDSTGIISSQWTRDNMNEFDTSIWSDWDEFYSDLSDTVTRLVNRGNNNVSYESAYSYLLKTKTGSESNGLSGVLRNERTGEPISGVHLKASWEKGYRYETVITDENGRYVFNYLPTNTLLTISPQNYLEIQSVYDLSQTEVYLGESDCTNFNLTALPYGAFSGKVVSETGAALENLLVIAWTEDGDYGFAYTDAEGQFEITNLRLGQYFVDVESAGKYNVPELKTIDVKNSQIVRGVDFTLSRGTGYTPQASLSSEEYTTIVNTYDELQFPASAQDINVIRLNDDTFTNLNLIRAFYISSFTTNDDVILLDTSKTISFKGKSIDFNIDETQYGTVSVIGIGNEHAKISVNPDYPTIHISDGVLQMGSVDFVSIANDDDWINLLSIISFDKTTDDSYVSGEYLEQDVNYYDTLGLNVLETYFELVEENGSVYYSEIASPVTANAMAINPEEALLPVITSEPQNAQALPNSNYALIFIGIDDSTTFLACTSRLLKILRNNYDIPKDNIYLLFGNGSDKKVYDWNNKAISTKSSEKFSKYTSHVYAATYTKFKVACQSINSRIQSDDHILVFTFDHGSGKNSSGKLLPNQYICGYNEDDIKDTDFASKTNFNAWTTYVLCQCYSGGILEDISMNSKRYGMSACNNKETAHGSITSGFWYAFVEELSFLGPTYEQSIRKNTSLSESTVQYQYRTYSQTGKQLYTYSKNNDYAANTGQDHPQSRGTANFPIFEEHVPFLQQSPTLKSTTTSSTRTFSWTKVSNATEYKLIIRNASSGKAFFNKTLSSSTSSYTFKLNELPNYSYKVEVWAYANISGYSLCSNSNMLSFTIAPKSQDPNEIIGPQGGDFVWHNEGTEDEPFRVIDGANWIKTDSEKEYKIYFENKKTAAAAAQEITVTTTLPAGMDWDTFEVDQIAIGNEIYTLSEESRLSDNTWLVNQASTGDQIKIRYEFNSQTGEVEWYLRSYVSDTYDNFPEDAYDGFLPPNDENHSGEGYISYRVNYKSDLNTGDVVTTNASITFDHNETIDTNIWFNTIDADAPAVQLDEASGVDTGISLQWSGSDVGSGIDKYQIYVSSDGSSYNLWDTFDADVTSAVYEADEGEYSFYILAVDSVGNVGGDPEQATPLLSVGPETPACPMDINGDGVIAVADYALLSRAWLSTPDKPNWNPACDFDGDGVVAISDYTYLSINWMKSVDDPSIVYPKSKTNSSASVSEEALDASSDVAISENVNIANAADAVSEGIVNNQNNQVSQANTTILPSSASVSVNNDESEVQIFTSVSSDISGESFASPLASPAMQLVSEHNVESSLTLLEAYSAALLDLYDNQDRADLSGASDVLAESIMDAQLFDVDSDSDSSQKTSSEAIDAVLEEELLAIDWN